MSKRAAWNDRYAASELLWGAEPNRFVAEAFAFVAARRRILDLAYGEGRDAIWLAGHGWVATGVDYSRVAIDRARRLTTHQRVEARFILAEVATWRPEPSSYASVLVAYLQLPATDLLQHGRRPRGPWNKRPGSCGARLASAPRLPRATTAILP